MSQSRRRSASPYENRRSKNQSRDEIPHPPGKPDCRASVPNSEASQTQTDDTQGRTDNVAESNKDDKFEDVIDVIEAVETVGETQYGPRCQHGFQGISSGDAKANWPGTGGSQVYKKRAQEHAGPETKAKQEQCRQCEAG